MAESDVEVSTGVVVDLTEKTPIRVLHVDDEAGFLKVAKQCLEMQGSFQVETASSVEEAMEKMKKKTFDVVVSDYVMPGKDGLEFLKGLRDSGNDVPFIIFTGKGREEVAIKALNLGADRYLNKGGDPETVYGELAHGIRKAVKRERAEEMLRRSEEKYRNLFENAKDVTLTLDLKGKITSINKAAVEYGFKKEDVIGKNQLKFVPKKYWPRLLKELVQIARGKMVEGEIEIITPKGKKIAEYRSNPVIIDNEIVGVQTIMRDVTERKRISERYRDLIEKEKDIIYALDDKGYITFASPAVETILGYRPQELTGKNFMVLTPKEWQEKTAADFNNLLKTGAITAETVLLDKNEQPHFVEYSSTVIKEGDKVVGTRGIVRDITERKKAEEEIKLFSDAVAGAIDGTAIVDMKGIITYANPAMDKLFGYKRGELVGKSVALLNANPETTKQHISTLTKTGSWYGEVMGQKKNKEAFPLLLSLSTIRDEKGKPIGMMGINRDITERKKAEEALRDAEERWISLTDNTDDTIVIADNKDIIRYINRTIPPTTPEGVIGKSVYDYVSKEHHNVMRESLKKVYKTGKPDSYEVVLDMSAINPKIGTLWFNTKVVPIKTDEEISGVIMVATNITERKKAEEELKKTLENVQILNEKLGVVGKLTRHDVRNKLSAVTGNVYLAKQKLTSDHEAMEYLREIEPAVRQMERIFDFARTYEKLGVEELAYMDVEKSVGEAVLLFSDLHGAKVVNDCRGLTVLADSLLRQLFYNLIHNSLKHGEKVTRIRVHYEEDSKDTLKLVYEDDGVGIPKAEKEKIFKEGYGKGTGYGLYLIRKMCEVYGWSIRETGKQGKGAQFTITIPRTGENGKILYKLQ